MKSKQYSNYFCRSLWLNMNTCSYSPVFISYLSYLFGSIYRHVFRDYIPEIIIHSPAQPFHLQNIGIQIVNQLIGIFVCLCCASPDTKTISSHKILYPAVTEANGFDIRIYWTVLLLQNLGFHLYLLTWNPKTSIPRLSWIHSSNLSSISALVILLPPPSKRNLFPPAIYKFCEVPRTSFSSCFSIRKQFLVRPCIFGQLPCSQLFPLLQLRFYLKTCCITATFFTFMRGWSKSLCSHASS